MQDAGWTRALRRRYEEFWLAPDAQRARPDRKQFACRPRRRLRGVLPFVPIVIALAILLVAIRSSNLGPYGRFAGYFDRVAVHSISATWRVPTATGDAGQASTWIGAQWRFGSGRFVQVGTIEQTGSANSAFWSDPLHHFKPVTLGEVYGGDLVSATLTQTSSGWAVRLVDHTLALKMTAVIREPPSARYTLAEWFQEDPTEAGSTQREPYPSFASVRFERLGINGRPPVYSALSSRWMSAPGGADYAPTPLEDDTFRVVRERCRRQVPRQRQDDSCGGTSAVPGYVP